MKILKGVFLCGVLFFEVHIYVMQPKKVSFSHALTKSQADLIKLEMAIFEQKKPVWYEIDYEAKLLMIHSKQIDKAYMSYVYAKGTLAGFNSVVEGQVSK